MHKGLMKKQIEYVLSKHTINEQIQILTTFDSCIKDLRKELQSKIDNDYCYCNNCHSYLLKKTLKTHSEEKTIHECVHTDCGYGDDDIYADVTYLFTYYICPKCGQKSLKDKYYLYENN